MARPSFLNQQDPSFSPGGFQVMIARAETFRNPLATRAKDDAGDLTWSQGKIRVHGKTTHRFNRVTDLAVVRRPVNWLTVGLGNLMAIALGYGSLTLGLTKSSAAIWLSILAINLLLFFSSLMRTDWLQVTYHSRPGVEETVYLVPIDSRGRPRRIQEVEQLHSTLREAVLASRKSPDTGASNPPHRG